MASFINDSRLNNNLIPKVIYNWPCFISGPNGIKAGDEVSYNYGDKPSKMPWRKVSHISCSCLNITLFLFNQERAKEGPGIMEEYSIVVNASFGKVNQ